MLAVKLNYLTVNINKLVVLMQLKAEKILEKNYLITYSQFLILHTINSLGSPTQFQIASCMSLTGAGTSKLISKLEFMGLIIKKVNINNKRANIITLTKKGENIINSALQTLENEFEKYINKTDKITMSKITDKTIEQLLNN